MPTVTEMRRIKAVLVLKRNATRDYVDLAEYKGLESRWHEWSAVEFVTFNLAAAILDQILDADAACGQTPSPRISNDSL